MLRKIFSGDKRFELGDAALNQKCVETAPAVFVITAIYNKILRRYSERGIRYVHIEVGHVAQNIFLQAVALNIGTVAVGAFYDENVKQVLKLPIEEEPLYIIPAGKL